MLFIKFFVFSEPSMLDAVCSYLNANGTNVRPLMALQ